MKVITRGELHDKIRNDGYAVTDLMNYIEIGVSTCPEATVSIDLIDSEKVMSEIKDTLSLCLLYTSDAADE